MSEPAPIGLPITDLQTTGLLWLINRVVFHPRGFALAIVKTDGEPDAWAILGDGREPWSFEGDEDERFARAEETLRSATEHNRG